jgi:hypothetical protein
LQHNALEEGQGREIGALVDVFESNALANAVLEEHQLAAGQWFQRLDGFRHLVLVFVVQVALELHQWLQKQFFISTTNFTGGLGTYSIFVSSRQMVSIVGFWQHDEATKHISQSVLLSVVQTAALVKRSSLAGAPGVAEFVVAKRSLPNNY